MAEGEEIIIRTMQDDLKGTSGSGQSVDVQAGPLTPHTVPQVGQREIEGKMFPLPPKSTKKKGKVLVPPLPFNFKRRMKRLPVAKVVLLVLVIFIVLGGIGAGAWVFFSGGINIGGGGGRGEVKAMVDMIPQDTLLAVHYDLNSQEARDAIDLAWQIRGDDRNILKLVDGDPRLVLEDQEVGELAYVVLARDPRPYMLLPVTTGVTEILNQNRSVRFSEVGGWYVLHSLGTDLYTEALADGALGDSLSLNKGDANYLTLFSSTSLIRDIRSSLLGDSFTEGELKATTWHGNFSGEVPIITFEAVESEIVGFDPLELVSKSDVEFLKMLPDDIGMARFGNDFATDVRNWGTDNNLDLSHLNQPNVSALLDKLTTPYVFYRRVGTDGADDYGLLARIPEPISPSVGLAGTTATEIPNEGALSLGDPALEEGFREFSQILLGQDPPSAPAFVETTYKDVNLKFVNIAGQTKSIDFAIIDDVLLGATSKEGILALIDVALGDGQSVEASAQWKQLLAIWGNMPDEAEDIFLGEFGNRIVTQFLPVSQEGTVQLGMTFEEARGYKGIILSRE